MVMIWVLVSSRTLVTDRDSAKVPARLGQKANSTPLERWARITPFPSPCPIQPSNHPTTQPPVNRHTHATGEREEGQKTRKILPKTGRKETQVIHCGGRTIGGKEGRSKVWVGGWVGEWQGNGENAMRLP